MGKGTIQAVGGGSTQPLLIEPPTPKTSVLYAGDCLHVLKDDTYVPDGSVDLIYIDPPWNTSETYVSFWKDSYRVMSFSDVFKTTKAYIKYMDQRVTALARKLKPTGSLRRG